MLSSSSKASAVDPRDDNLPSRANVRSTDSRRSEATRLIDLFNAGWHSGQFAKVEDFFAEFPMACSGEEIAVQLVYEEFCLRQEAGQQVPQDEIFQRFPQWRSKLELALDCHEALQSAECNPEFPETGEQLGEFQLTAELGRGAAGRVYLATQPSLSDRSVVVKVIPRRGDEHLSLARLQHSSIVPLYFVQEFPDKGLRLMCMPYVGGISLLQLFNLLANVSFENRTGQQIVESLRSTQLAFPVVAKKGPAIQFLQRASYAQAVCWIGACLADALHYAHERDLIHLDIKPSNILLAADGQPMLLDFHLAHETLPENVLIEDWLGGTPGYSSPEQQQAIASVRRACPSPVAIDGRSDIYSLGLTLCEMLGCRVPANTESISSPTELEFANGIPPRLITILKKCLRPNPRDRFADASQLAIELRHCLIEPATERVSPRQNTANSTRDLKSHIRFLVTAAIFMTLGILSVTAVRFFQRDTAIRIGSTASNQHLAPLPSPARPQLDNELHSLVENLRFVSAADSLAAYSAEDIRELDRRCHQVWLRREQWIDGDKSLSLTDRQRNRQTDLLELAILWAELHERISLSDDATHIEQARNEAWQVLAEAENDLGSGVVLSRVQNILAAAMGLENEVQRTNRLALRYQPQTAWEYWAIGRTLMREGDIEQAATILQKAIELEPQQFWPNFLAGICAYQTGRFERALVAFSACVAIDPRRAEAYFNRGLSYRALGQIALSDRDFGQARLLNPSIDR